VFIQGLLSKRIANRSQTDENRDAEGAVALVVSVLSRVTQRLEEMPALSEFESQSYCRAFEKQDE
jgi:hypothetical protein